LPLINCSNIRLNVLAQFPSFVEKLLVEASTLLSLKCHVPSLDGSLSLLVIYFISYSPSYLDGSIKNVYRLKENLFAFFFAIAATFLLYILRSIFPGPNYYREPLHKTLAFRARY
jgi:hypothetical protein